MLVDASLSGCPYGPRGSAEEVAVEVMPQPCCCEEIYDPEASAVVWKDRMLLCGGEDGLRRLTQTQNAVRGQNPAVW